MNDSNKELVVLLQNTPIGVLSEDKQGKHSFTYFPGTDESLQLSIAMPHRVSAWTGKVVEAYIDGILPDDPNVRQRIGRQYGVNARNPFALLSAIGLECAGGVQFVPPEDVDSLHERNELVPVSERQIGERLRTLTRDGQASWLANDEHWSLNGAQEKIALRRQNGQWYEAHGAAATTHIRSTTRTIRECSTRKAISASSVTAPASNSAMCAYLILTNSRILPFFESGRRIVCPVA